MVTQATTATNTQNPAIGPNPVRGAAVFVNSQDPKNQVDKEVEREKSKSLLAHAGDSAKKLTENVTKTAIDQTTDAAKKGAKSAASFLLHTTFAPVTLMIHTLEKSTNGMSNLAIDALSRWMTPKVDSHFEKLGLKFSMPTAEIVHNLLHGDFSKLSNEVIDALADYVEKVMPPEIKAALSSGSPMKIISATGMSMMSSAKDLMGGIQKEQGWFVTKPFKWMGAKVPYMNKLPKAIQPWAAGGVAFMFGGMILRGMKKLFKLAMGGALLATVFGFGKKILAGGMKANSGAGGLGNLMGAVSGMTGGHGGGHGAAGGAGGLMDMANLAMGALSKMKK